MQKSNFLIGSTVKRIKSTWNDMKVGDTAIVDGIKNYNNSICLHLKGDKPDTWHSARSFVVV